MTLRRCSTLLALLSMLWLTVSPAWGANKEMIQLQTQVQQLQEQMTAMQRSFDERMGVMKNLVERDTDAINKATGALTALQATLQKQQGDSATHVDQLSGQIQSLNDTLDELKARLAKVSKQLDDMQTAQQNITAPPAGSQPGGPSGAANNVPQAPPADQLYNDGLRDYNANKNDLASQEFAQFLQVYGNTDLAGNAQFYMGEIAYRQGNFAGAVQAYNKVLDQYPGGNKTAAAQLKKAYALLELGQRDAGVQELRSLISRYPKSPEALQARDRLTKLGAAGAASKKPARPSPSHH